MPQSLAQLYVHGVFSTKSRQPFLRDRALREVMHAYLAGTCQGLDSPAVIVGGTEDHVHCLARLAKTLAVSDLVKEIKRTSSAWAKEPPRCVSGFHWQAGYGVFSVSAGDVGEVVAYIRDQEAHHRRETFQDELRRLFRAHGIEWDERYVWD